MWFFLGVLFLLLVLETIRSNLSLRVRMEDITLDTLPPALDGLGLVHITDLHGRRFGRRNANLARYIRHHHPDLILASGDMMEGTPQSANAFCELLDALHGQYPVYFSLGNHERNGFYADTLPETLEKCTSRGAVLLDNGFAEWERRGTSCRIYGFAPGQWKGGCRLSTVPALVPAPEELDAALGVSPQDTFTLLLAHDPDGFPGYAGWGADLTLSGHIHGGLWRPFGVGLLSPTRRFFPPYSAGVYRTEGSPSVLFVSTGLAGALIPRLFNRPEIAVLTLRAGRRTKKGGVP